MTDSQNTAASADEKDQRIAALEAELAATKEAPVAPEKTVVLKHSNGTKVRVAESQADGLKAAGFKK